jgi:Oxidoreductase FAD-binding domain
VYFPTADGKPGGEMTQLLEHMSIGDTASIRGPEGRISYQGRGVFDMEASHTQF